MTLKPQKYFTSLKLVGIASLLTEVILQLKLFFCCPRHVLCFSRNAMVGIIRKGGLSSLYAGWGAVLCRNVPHSIIKVRFCILDDIVANSWNCLSVKKRKQGGKNREGEECIG